MIGDREGVYVQSERVRALVLVVLVLGGCYAEATFGVAKWRSDERSSVARVESWHSPSVDLGVAIGAFLDEHRVALHVGEALDHDRGRERSTSFHGVSGRLDVTLAALELGNLRATVAYARRSGRTDLGFGDYDLHGHDRFVGLALDRARYAGAIGYRDTVVIGADMRRVDGPLYEESRRGIQLRAIGRFSWRDVRDLFR